MFCLNLCYKNYSYRNNLENFELTIYDCNLITVIPNFKKNRYFRLGFDKLVSTRQDGLDEVKLR